MDKLGQQQNVWYVIRWALLGVLLVLVVWMLGSGQMAPIIERVEGEMNKVLLIIGVAENGTEALKCNERVENVLGTSAKVVACSDYCYVLFSGHELLSHEKFMISKSFYAGDVEDEDESDMLQSDGFGVNRAISDRHKDSYDELVDVFYSFYEESGSDLSEAEFFDVLEFNPRGYFRLAVYEGSVEDEDDFEFSYHWNGDRWTREAASGYVSYKTDEETEDVFTEIYEKYILGAVVTWNYAGDGGHRVPLSNFDVKLTNNKFTEEEFDAWMNKHSDDEIRVNVRSDKNNVKWNLVCKNNKWKQDNFLFFDTSYEADEILRILSDSNEAEFEMSWNYLDDNKRQFIPVSDEEIVTRESDFGRLEFSKWLYSVKNNFTRDYEAYSEVMIDFDEFVSSTDVSLFNEVLLLDVSVGDVLEDYEAFRFEVIESGLKGESWEIVLEDEFGAYWAISGEPNLVLRTYEDLGYRVVYSTGIDSDKWPRSLIRFVDEIGGKFGMYYFDDEFVLTHGEDYRESPVNGWFDLSDSEWEEFLEINDVFDYLGEKC